MLVLPPRRRQVPTWPEYLADRATRVQHPLLEGYFAAGCPAPDTPIGEVPLVAMDMETTGLDPRRHAIVSIGLVPFSLARIRLADRHYWVVRPPRPLNRQSVTLHRITHAEVEHAPDLEAILPALFEALAGRLVVVHYRQIERPFLDSAVQARLGEGLRFPVIDTMSLEARRHRQSVLARLRRWMGRPPVSIRLHNSRERYGLPPYQGHHALVDALATAELLQAQIAAHYSPDTPVGELWS
ncbi:DNA polymerase-3 subunit epsilon [Halomonas campaniensis]|uniref:DNA polymerase-3 subunit epsilon n=1 Tax=Halomonas campaniensis TaxID=213554 RepID=A0A7W5PAP3_9GAMM|nr:3'-5' exonuclease [Halomonas campaniensis]MBB3330111.1 DNA polymerase-3 subunit epsilon [Halomonas campaniensis]